MCYFHQTRWRCGYWKWGNFVQQCNKEYRTGETCGRKFVYDTNYKNQDCRLCEDMRKKQRRYSKMAQDVERWRREGNRKATIAKAECDMVDIREAITKIEGEHTKRLMMIDGDYTDRGSVSAEQSSESIGALSTAHPTTFEPVVLPIIESRTDWVGALSDFAPESTVGVAQHVREPIQVKTEGPVALLGRRKQDTSSPTLGSDHLVKFEALSGIGAAFHPASPPPHSVLPTILDLKARPTQHNAHYTAESTDCSTTIPDPDAHRRHTIAKAITDPHAGLPDTYENRPSKIIAFLSKHKLAQTNEVRPSEVVGDQRVSEKAILQVERPDSITNVLSPQGPVGSFTSSDDESFVAKAPEDPKKQMLDRLLTAFDLLWDETWTARTFNSGDSPSGGNHRTFASSQSGYTNATTEKRKRKPENDGDDNNEEAPREHALPPQDQSEPADPRTRRLACPYHQRNPDRHTSIRSCKGLGFLGAHRVKEHLYNHHELPIRCPRCLETFPTQLNLDNHHRQDERCEKKTEHIPREGFNHEQKTRLKKKMQGSDEHKWRTIYRVLFPNDREEDIPSPYVYDTRGTGELEKYVSFMGRETKRRVRQKIEKAINVELAPLERELLLKLPDLVFETQQEIYHDYRSAKAAPPAPNPPLSSAGLSNPRAMASPKDLLSPLNPKTLSTELATCDPTMLEWYFQQFLPDIEVSQYWPQLEEQASLYDQGLAPETDGERAAREAFQQDHPGAIERIPTSATGLRCGWESLVRSWQSLRDQLERQVRLLYGDITVDDLDRVYRREAVRNPDFLMENYNMFRIDQMAIVLSVLLFELFGIHVQLGYVHPHRGQAYFAVLVPYQEGVQPNFRLWVFNNNASAADWNNAHFEGIRDADNSRGLWHVSCEDEDREEGCESCALDEQLNGKSKGKGICLHKP